MNYNSRKVYNDLVSIQKLCIKVKSHVNDPEKA